MKHLLIFILLFSFGFTLVANDPQVKIVRILDGNTLEVEFPNKETEIYLLRSVDSPELEQNFGAKAQAYLEKIALKKKVTITQSTKDRWGNRMAILVLKNGKTLNQMVLKNGFGWFRDNKENKAFQALELNAKNQKIGLWTEENPMAPWIYKRKKSMTTAKSR